MRANKGFSLIELLIVVAIILIIAAIAIPNLLQAKIAANESSAAGSLRTLTSAEVTYYNSYPTVALSTTSWPRPTPVVRGKVATIIWRPEL